MHARVYSHKDLIGTANLEVVDNSMGCLYGEFKPTEKYFQIAQNIIRKFWETQNPDYGKMKSLRLNVQLDNDYFLFPAGGITIEDSLELPNEPLKIDIAGLDRIVFDEFNGKSELPNFVEKPWNPLSIEEKIGLENQLFTEIGVESQSKSWLNIFKPKPENHVLSDFHISALCKDQRNDDVLFVTRQLKSDYQFAVVHLTWKNQKERPGYPRTEFYHDFTEFKNTRLKADANDWN